MDIYPKDLGERRQKQAWVKVRVRPAPSGPRRPLRMLLMLGGVVTLAWPGHAISFPQMTLSLFLVMVIVTLKLVPMLISHRQAQTSRNAPLQPAQVAGMLAVCHDPLESEYLRLVLAAAQLPASPEATAQSEIREAVRALGAAIEKLPPPTPPALSALKLRGKAASLADEAAREADPVVAASLRRRAETRGHQAQTAALMETLARRQAALRQEVSDEMDALQTSLAAFQAEGVWSVAEMADVAAGIGGIALKARTMAAAQAESDEALQGEHLPDPAPNGPGGTAQRLQSYRTDDTEDPRV